MFTVYFRTALRSIVLVVLHQKNVKKGGGGICL